MFGIVAKSFFLLITIEDWLRAPNVDDEGQYFKINVNS